MPKHLIQPGDTMTGDLNMGANKIILHALKAHASDGLSIYSVNDTLILLLGAGGGANATFYNGVNITGVLGLSGGMTHPVAIKSTDYTLTTSDYIVVFTATSTATLPAATGSGRTYRIICRAGILTIDGNSTDTIKGELTQTLTAGEDLLITDCASGIYE